MCEQCHGESASRMESLSVKDTEGRGEDRALGERRCEKHNIQSTNTATAVVFLGIKAGPPPPPLRLF